MELVNTTPLVVGCTVGTDNHGLDHLLALAKATYHFDAAGTVWLADVQRPLIGADEYSGDPGYSATVVESDYALLKPNCDVLLTGSAYTPVGRPASDVVVSLSVGKMRKSLRVTGHRTWQAGFLGKIEPGPPHPFVREPFSYDTAFGGIDDFHEDAQKHTSCRQNPVGVGYHKELEQNLMLDTPMPNTEEINDPIREPNGQYRPMAFGPLGRGWPQRMQYAGTYGAEWQENQFPFLPQDFDNRYFQAAPPDQQIPVIKGGERVELRNLTESCYCEFQLPRLGIESVVFYLRTGEYLIVPFRVDTLHLFPDDGLFTLTARASVPFSDDPQTCSKVIFGRGSRGWVRALESGKRFVSREQKLMVRRAPAELAATEDSG